MIDFELMTFNADSLPCSTTFCLVNAGNEYLAYQPAVTGDIRLGLPAGNYETSCFDTIDNSVNKFTFSWEGGVKTFNKTSHISEDWLLYIKGKKQYPEPLCS
jgi:hypothetical protein